MHAEIFGFTTESLGSVSYLALLLILTSLLIVQIFRLGVLAFATDRAKERREAVRRPVAGRKMACRGSSAEDRGQTQKLGLREPLSTAVMRYLDQVEACNREPESEPTEGHLIRSETDMAAELFRAPKVERKQENG